MACSPAQLASNRLNSQKSTGPKTEDGKARSRRNGLKHGLTGSGVVLHSEDAAELERRSETLEAEMAPKCELARRCVERVALMTVKLDRCSEHEAKAISYQMRHAVEAFDHVRLAEVEKAYSWIAHEPSTNVRLMKKHPEGFDLLINALENLKSDLDHPDGVRWGWGHCEHLHHLMGLRPLIVPATRARALSEAIMGDFSYLNSNDAPDLAKIDRQVWAVSRLGELIDAEVAKLKAGLEKLDRVTLELDRLEAPARAMFDDSKKAILARKYESSAERALYRAIKEFRAAQDDAELTPEVVASQEPGEELASSLPEPDPVEDEDTEMDEIGADIDVPRRPGLALCASLRRASRKSSRNNSPN